MVDSKQETRRSEHARICFLEGFNCAQAVLSTFAPALGLDRETALRIAGAFGAGMGRLGETCGAVTGATMAIGLVYGKTAPEDNERREKAYAAVRAFHECFRSRHGSTVCRDLLGCDVSTPEGIAAAREMGLFSTVCPNLVQDAVEIIEDLLGQELEPEGTV